MTWTAHMRIEDVSDGPAPISVRLTASADQTVKPYEHRDDLAVEHREYEQTAIVSNTEGKIRNIEMTLVLDEDHTTLKPGDIVNVNGHFDGRTQTPGG